MGECSKAPARRERGMGGRRAYSHLSAILLAIGLLFAARAQAEDAPQPAPPPPGQALIYIYRVPSFAFALDSAAFDVDKTDIIELYNKNYTWFYVPASAHVMRLSTGGIGRLNVTLLTLLNEGTVYDWREGNTYYYRLNGYFLGTAIAWRVSPIDEAQALRELAVYRYVAPHNLDKLKVNRPLSPATATPEPASAASAPATPAPTTAR